MGTKKNNVYSCKPQFYYIKVGFKGVKIIWACFRDALHTKTSADMSLLCSFKEYWVKNSADDTLIFFCFFLIIPSSETFCMKCQCLFSGINKKNISLSSAEFTKRVVKGNP